MANERINELYTKWWLNRTPEELNLHKKVLEYEEKYFRDMNFESDSILKDYIMFYNGNGNDEESADIYYSLDNFQYRYLVKKLDDCGGETNQIKRTITIDPKYIENKSLILHEIIHAHINIIQTIQPFLRDALLICLYKYNKEKIDDLDQRILKHANIVSGLDISRRGGSHDILFFLKSLELDLRCGYKLGTICGYGRDE